MLAFSRMLGPVAAVFLLVAPVGNMTMLMIAAVMLNLALAMVVLRDFLNRPQHVRVSIAQAELEGVEDFEALERREQILLARRVVLREMGTMTIGAILIVTLALRAASTG